MKLPPHGSGVKVISLRSGWMKRRHTVHPGLLHGAVQYVPGFGQIVFDTRVVAPSVGGEDKRGHVIQFAVRRRSLRIARTIVLQLLRNGAETGGTAYTSSPTPKASRRYLYGRTARRSSVRRTCLPVRVMILDVADIGHRVAHLKI